MKPIRIRRHDITLLPDSARVIIRPFIPGSSQYITTIIGRALALTEDEVSPRACHRPGGIRLSPFRYRIACCWPTSKRCGNHVFTQRPLSRHDCQLLIGALFSGEYALESAAIFNPSMVPHPDQSDAPAGGLRFIMSLRATGEGHISSIEFRAGTIDRDGEDHPRSGLPLRLRAGDHPGSRATGRRVS